MGDFCLSLTPDVDNVAAAVLVVGCVFVVSDSSSGLEEEEEEGGSFISVLRPGDFTVISGLARFKMECGLGLLPPPPPPATLLLVLPSLSLSQPAEGEERFL